MAEDGREYYAVSTQFNAVNLFNHAWLNENVAPHLPWEALPPGTPLTWVTAERNWSTGLWKGRVDIRKDVLEFCDLDKYGKPEFWAYYADYDWVALCQLFGTMMDLPKDWPRYCRDLKQFSDLLGKPKNPAPPTDEHNALADARWNRTMWNNLFMTASTFEIEDLGYQVMKAFDSGA